MTSRILSESPLVGREHELEELNNFLDLAAQGKGTTVFVSGAAGSGKTRLVREFLASAQQKRGIIELAGWCLCNSGVPYFPFIEAFNAYFGKIRTEASAKSEELGLKAWLLGPEKSARAEKPGVWSPQAWKDSAFAAVSEALYSIAAKKPTILFIDDLHWADTASLALLQYVSRFILSRRLLILGTYRSEDLNSDSEGHPHPLVDMFRLMGRESLFKEIKLSNLNHSDVSLLAENMMQGRIQTQFAEKLTSESQGNPLFIIETLRMLSEMGSLVQENNRWKVSTNEIGIPTKVKDIILRRMETLMPVQRKILDIASVIGLKFNPELLGKISAQATLEILEELNTIEKSTALVVSEGDNYRFDHAKSRDALYEEIAPPLRKAYHSRVAEELESLQKSKDEKLPVGDLAFHYAQAGNKEKAVKYSLSAGKEALALFCGGEAIKHFKYVLNVGSENIAYSNENMTALEGLADGLYALGRCREALKVMEQLDSSNTPSAMRLRALRKAIYISMVAGDSSHALEITSKVTEDLLIDPLECARLRLYKGMMKNWMGNSEEALRDIKEALKVFETECSFPDMIDVLTEMGTTLVKTGQLENAIAAVQRARAFSEYARNLNRQDYTTIMACFIFNKSGLQKEASEGVADAFKINEKISDPNSRAFNLTFDYWMLGLALEAKAATKLFSGLPLESIRNFGTAAKIKFFISSLFSGALREFKLNLKAAIVQSSKAEEYTEETDSYIAKTNALGNLTRQYSELGDMEQAEKYQAYLLKVFNQSSLSGVLWSYQLFLFSNAIFFSSKKQWKEANQFFEDTLKIHKKEGPPDALEAGTRQSYGWSLLQQGRNGEANLQFEKARDIMSSLESRFVHSKIQAYSMAPIKVETGKEFNMRLDLINVGKNSSNLVRVEGILPADFKAVAIHPQYNILSNSVELAKKSIKPFTDEAITLTVQAMKAGDYLVESKLIFTDDLGEYKTVEIEPVRIVAESTSNVTKEQT
jgi:hypothetical protein